MTSTAIPETIDTSGVSDQEVRQVNAFLEHSHPRDAIRWALQRFPADQRVVVTALQAEGVAVADMAIAMDPDVRVLTIDTGRLPEATHQYLDRLRRHWNRALEVVHPESAALDAFAGEHGANPFYASPQLRLDCCHLRKVDPLERTLAGVDCWMSGLRRSQSARRSATSVVERDHRHGGIVKLNPLAAWSDDDVHAYLGARGVPVHPLYSQGYRSIGCAPCTRPVAADEDARAGRWWWEQGIDRECGIHATPRLVASGVGG